MKREIDVAQSEAGDVTGARSAYWIRRDPCRVEPDGVVCDHVMDALDYCRSAEPTPKLGKRSIVRESDGRLLGRWGGEREDSDEVRERQAKKAKVAA